MQLSLFEPQVVVSNKVVASRWDMHWFRVAQEAASMSKDVSTQVGAVLVRNKREVATGFNGFPQRIKDDKKLIKDRKEKYKRTIHAEANAILFAGGIHSAGSTLYTWPLPPCSACALLAIQCGIVSVRSVVLPEEYEDRWGEAHKTAVALFKEAGVEVILFRDI